MILNETVFVSLSVYEIIFDKGQHDTSLIENQNNIVENDDLVDVSLPSASTTIMTWKKNWSSSIVNDVPVLCVQPKPTKASAEQAMTTNQNITSIINLCTTTTKAAIAPKPTTNIVSTMNAITMMLATFINCTFNFGN